MSSGSVEQDSDAVETICSLLLYERCTGFDCHAEVTAGCIRLKHSPHSVRQLTAIVDDFDASATFHTKRQSTTATVFVVTPLRRSEPVQIHDGAHQSVLKSDDELVRCFLL